MWSFKADEPPTDLTIAEDTRDEFEVWEWLAEQNQSFRDEPATQPAVRCRCSRACDTPCFQRVGLMGACRACGCDPFEAPDA